MLPRSSMMILRVSLLLADVGGARLSAVTNPTVEPRRIGPQTGPTVRRSCRPVHTHGIDQIHGCISRRPVCLSAQDRGKTRLQWSSFGGGVVMGEGRWPVPTTSFRRGQSGRRSSCIRRSVYPLHGRNVEQVTPWHVVKISTRYLSQLNQRRYVSLHLSSPCCLLPAMCM